MTKASVDTTLIMQKDQYGNVFYDTYLHPDCVGIKKVSNNFFNKRQKDELKTIKIR